MLFNTKKEKEKMQREILKFIQEIQKTWKADQIARGKKNASDTINKKKREQKDKDQNEGGWSDVIGYKFDLKLFNTVYI